MNLIIIGNGFDLYHGIPSSYQHFKCYVEKCNNSLYNKLNELFCNSDLLWSDFENTLGEPDFATIRLDAEDCIDYEKSDRTQPDYDTYHFIIEENLIEIDNLIESFGNWVKDRLEKYIDLIDCSKFNLNKNDIYLSFNYTTLLEKLYNINDDNILYIHNKVNNGNNRLVVGHRNTQEVENNCNINEIYNLNNQGEDVENKYLKKTFKPIENIIEYNSNFFEKLSSINKICILGHSLSVIDKKYFEEVAKYVTKETKWIVSYYKEEELNEHKIFLYDLGIDKKNIEVHKIYNITLNDHLDF